MTVATDIVLMAFPGLGVTSATVRAMRCGENAIDATKREKFEECPARIEGPSTCAHTGRTRTGYAMTAKPDIDSTVRAFITLLATSWPSIEVIAQEVSTGSHVQDWMQANWEMIVEGTLPPGKMFLEVYGEGADCNGRSPRVYEPEALATHAVMCVAPTGAGIVKDLLNQEHFALGAEGLPLEEFVTLDEGWFARKPPFDCVLLDDGGRERVVSAKAVRFALGPAIRG